MNIIILAAGKGQRFKDAGYDKPKHLIDVGGLPMFRRVTENIGPRFIGTPKIILQRQPEGYTLETTYLPRYKESIISAISVDSSLPAKRDLQRPLLISLK